MIAIRIAQYLQLRVANRNAVPTLAHLATDRDRRPPLILALDFFLPTAMGKLPPGKKTTDFEPAAAITHLEI